MRLKSKNLREVHVRIENIFVNAMWIGKIKHTSLLEAICSLSPDAQLALHMAFWERKGYGEIASRLNVSECLAGQIIVDTLKHLRKSLGEDRILLLGLAA
jgi:DNA-directed RNA polymerase specialized sigma24 family protein